MKCECRNMSCIIVRHVRILRFAPFSFGCRYLYSFSTGTVPRCLRFSVCLASLCIPWCSLTQASVRIVIKTSFEVDCFWEHRHNTGTGCKLSGR